MLAPNGVGRNKPVRAIARTGVSGAPIAGNAPPLLSPGGLIPAYV